MPGMGPAPKDPRLRQRMNKVTTRATLPAEVPKGRPVPELPKREKGMVPWHPETVADWDRLWQSPESMLYTPAMFGQLVVMFKVLDAFNYGDIDRAAEVRLQAARFGLDVMAQRRLQWEREQDGHKPQAPPVRTGTDDPRKFLRAVK